MHGRLECADKLWRRENKAELVVAPQNLIHPNSLVVFEDLASLWRSEMLTSESFLVASGGEPLTRTALLLEAIALRHCFELICFCDLLASENRTVPPTE